MDWTCLLIDIDEAGVAETWQGLTADRTYPLQLSFASINEAEALLDTGMVASIVVFGANPEKRASLLSILDSYRKKVGPIAIFQALVAADPDPDLLNDVFEYGIEKFLRDDTWAVDLQSFLEGVATILADEQSSEFQTIRLARSMAKGDKGGIADAEKILGETSRYDYLAAYSKGNALQAIGKFEEAAEAFQTSGKMNKMFRPADVSLGENYMIMGKVDEAIAVFEKLDKQNARNIDRKANLAVAYLEKGDPAKANQYLAEAQALNPGHPRLAEAQAQIALSTGKINEAFKMMDNLKDVGPLFAAKLNEMGIKLSQQGKGKSALALYQKAHKIVRKELRYKISLNAALACYRMQDFATALKYVGRCEQEYGKKFDKTEKIRAACTQAMKQAS